MERPDAIGSVAAMVAYSPQYSLSTSGALGLLTACPWTQSNPADCALHDVRTMPLAERYELVRDATPADLAEFISACAACPCCRHARGRG